jgi:hypothetical protein
MMKWNFEYEYCNDKGITWLIVAHLTHFLENIRYAEKEYITLPS